MAEVMRSAASRLVGAAVRGVLRGRQSVPKLEYQTPLTAERQPASAIAASNERGSSVVAEKGPLSGVDGREFAGVEDKVSFGSGDSSLPRVVFGGAPSFDEAKEATWELKAAVDKTLLTSENGTIPRHKEAGLPMLMGSEKSDSITCVSSEVASVNAVPKHAVQAFRLLSQNPAVQTVVASVASDPNLWDAVLGNKAFVDYLKSHRADAMSHEVDVHINQHISIEELQDCYTESVTSFVGLSESSKFGTSISEILQTIKLTMMDIVDHVSNFFQHLFGVPDADKKPTDDAFSSTSSFTESTSLAASILGLAIIVILMVVLKRV